MAWQEAVEALRRHMHAAWEERNFGYADSLAGQMRTILEDPDAYKKRYSLTYD